MDLGSAQLRLGLFVAEQLVVGGVGVGRAWNVQFAHGRENRVPNTVRSLT
jgi:hypothetical protein